MRPTNDHLQRYLLSAERAPPVDPETAAWARKVLEDALQRAERAERARLVLPPSPERHVYHTR